MGDRATIRIKQAGSDTAIHFYTHWRGSCVRDVVANALLRAATEGRITNSAYCSRIVFDSLTELEGGSTGYGIIVGDDHRPGDVAHHSPSVVWTASGEEPLIGFMNREGGISAHMPWWDWVKLVTDTNLRSA